MNLNTCPTSVDFSIKELLIDWEDDAINSKETVKVKAATQIGFGEPVKFDSYAPDGLTAIVTKWAPGDDVYGLATCCADTNVLAADGVTPCNDSLCVLRRDAKVRAGGIVWPTGITAAQKTAAVLFLREDRRIFVTQTV